MSAPRALRALFIPRGHRPRQQNRQRELHVKTHTVTTVKGERQVRVTLSDGTLIIAVGCHGSYEQWVQKNGRDAHGNKLGISRDLVSKYTLWLNGG